MLQQAEETSKLDWGKEIENCTFAPIGRKEKQAELGEKLKKRIFAPTGRRDKQVEFWGKVEKKDICSNRQKEEASWIGAKRKKTGYLLQQKEKKRKTGRSNEVGKRRIAPIKE